MSVRRARFFVLVACIICSIWPLHSSAKFLAQTCQALYGAMLGFQDASQYYTNLTHEACKRCGLDDSICISVKKMSPLFKYLTRDNLASCTLDGVWINEEAMNQMSEPERIFTIQHEVTHYFKKHHRTLLAALFASSVVLFLAPKLATKMLYKPKTNVGNYTMVGGIGLATIAVIDYVLMQPLVRAHEHEAEVEAANLLCQTGHVDILQEHINYLQSLLNRGETYVGRWWESIPEQIEYLNACVEQYQNK